MPKRLAACEPCRSSKLACDHAHPVCSRCREAGQPASCTYRERPFKRKRASEDVASSEVSSPCFRHFPANEPGPPDDTPARSFSRKYPNPGYLGNSSHATIFELLPQAEKETLNGASPGCERDGGTDDQDSSFIDATQVSRGAALLRDIRGVAHIGSWRSMAESWLARGVNLALAAPFTPRCAETMGHVLDILARKPDDIVELSRKLSLRSSFTPATNPDMILESYCTRFSGRNACWEALGLFFATVSRATVDLVYFEPLYYTRSDRQAVLRKAVQFCDRCLDLCISLDSMSDLQLILQFENFVAHTLVDGDQSYHSWRKLGDVISSIYALGYHEKLQHGGSVPPFLKRLRATAFALAFSADKNVSIFLGRPPRMLSRFCRFRVPGPELEILELGSSFPLPDVIKQWTQERRFDYAIEAAWSALCALFKEVAMDIVRESTHSKRLERAMEVQREAEAQWQALPGHLRLEGPLKLIEQMPVMRDFMLSARLNYLHVHFLLRRALAKDTPAPDARLVEVSAAILNLSVEALVLKDLLANSGTSLGWKVAYYGLPAAGIICLSLLNRSSASQTEQPNVSKAFSDLSVLVAELEGGAFVYIDDPNYALLTGATRAIKRLLETFLSGAIAKYAPFQSVEWQNPGHETAMGSARDWMPWTNQEAWDFEIDFWRNLEEHPTLTRIGDET